MTKVIARITLALIAGLAALLMLVPATASATTYSAAQDQQYISMIVDRGVPVSVSGGGTAISLGHTVADTIAAHPSEATITEIGRIGMQSFEEHGFTMDQSATYTAAIIFSAVNVYQPSLLPLLTEWTADHAPIGATVVHR